LIKEGGNFFKDVKVKELLKTYEFIYPTWDKELAEELVDIYKLPRKAKTKALSKGMAYALGIIVGLASKAQVKIFDEPYIGLDADGRKSFFDIILDDMLVHSSTFIFFNILIVDVCI